MQDLIEWFKEYIEGPYLNMIYGELELEEEDYTFDYSIKTPIVTDDDFINNVVLYNLERSVELLAHSLKLDYSTINLAAIPYYAFHYYYVDYNLWVGSSRNNNIPLLNYFNMTGSNQIYELSNLRIFTIKNN
jgi:hypothetical protein